MANAMTSAPTLASNPDSAAPRARRFVSAAPSALPTLTAPAATRPALPERARRAAGSALRSLRPHAIAVRQHDLGRVREVDLVLRRHRFAEAAILDRDVELVVAHPARDIEVGRADARPEARRRPRSSRAASFRSTRRRGRRRRAAADSRRARSATAPECRSRREPAGARRPRRGPRRQAPARRPTCRRNRHRRATGGAGRAMRSRDRVDRCRSSLGAPATTRRRTSPARRRHCGRVRPASPAAARRRTPATPSANARVSSATAGPRISTPVSRHGSIRRVGIAQPLRADAQAGDEADRPSTTIVLR